MIKIKYKVTVDHLLRIMILTCACLLCMSTRSVSAYAAEGGNAETNQTDEKSGWLVGADAHYTLLTGKFHELYEHGPGASLLLGYQIAEHVRIGLLNRFSLHKARGDYEDMYRLAFNFILEANYLWENGLEAGGKGGLGLGYTNAYYRGTPEYRGPNSKPWLYDEDEYGFGCSFIVGLQAGYRVTNWLQIDATFDLDLIAKRPPSLDEPEDGEEKADSPEFAEVMFAAGLRLTFVF